VSAVKALKVAKKVSSGYHRAKLLEKLLSRPAAATGGNFSPEILRRRDKTDGVSALIFIYFLFVPFISGEDSTWAGADSTGSGARPGIH
jgi:hypothetical protein